MKIRLWGEEEECRQAAEALMQAPGLRVVSISEPRKDRGASVLVRVYVEARLDDQPGAAHVASTTRPARRRLRELPAGRSNQEEVSE